MPLAAVDDIGDALTATRQFLFPFDAGRWLRLAVIAFFVGSAGGGSGGGGGGGGGDGGSGGPPDLGTLPDIALSDAAIGALVGLVGLALLLGLAYTLIGAIMEFVLVESLRREEVHLRRYFGQYWRAGLRLFGFRLAVGLIGVVGVLVVLGGLFFAAGGPSTVDSPLQLLPAGLLALPLVVGIALSTALALGFTRDFVVPVMLVEETTVLGGWRRFWPTLRAEWREYAVYVVIAFLLRIGIGLAVAIVTGILAVVVLIPFGVLGLVTYVAGGGQLGLLTLTVLGGLGLIAVVVILAVAALVGVPVVTYFRYYALLVLGDTEAEFDVISDRRATIREESAND